jgi:hypothetical protein
MRTKWFLFLGLLGGLGVAACGFPNPFASESCGFSDVAVNAAPANSVQCAAPSSTAGATSGTSLLGQNPPE